MPTAVRKALHTPTCMVDGVGASSPAARSRRAREAAVLAVMHDVAVGRGDDSEGLPAAGRRREERPPAGLPAGRPGGWART